MIPKHTENYTPTKALLVAQTVRDLLLNHYKNEPPIADEAPPNVVHFWRGQRIENLTRDELLECVRHQAAHIQYLENLPKDFKKMARDRVLGAPQ